MKPNTLVWFDCETTGLDAGSDSLLEVAVVLTDENLVEHAHYQQVLPFDEEISDDWVRDQHTKSGLLAECRAVVSVDNRAAAQRSALGIVEFLLDHGITDKIGVLAGSSIHFDRAFVKRHMPPLDAHLHYRMVDVSTLNELAMRWAPDVYDGRPTVPREQIAHRAMPDILGSIEALRYYLAAGLFGHAR